MATDQPFNELGRILSTGGEIALGLAILQDLGSEGFLLFFNRRFAPISDTDRTALISLSESMIAGGEEIQKLQLGQDIDPKDIPINEWLFGQRLEGRRVLITGEVEFPGATHRIQVRMAFPDIPTMAEVREAFLAQGLTVTSSNPEGFGLPEGEAPAGGNVYILLPERAF